MAQCFRLKRALHVGCGLSLNSKPICGKGLEFKVIIRIRRPSLTLFRDFAKYPRQPRIRTRETDVVGVLRTAQDENNGCVHFDRARGRDGR